MARALAAGALRYGPAVRALVTGGAGFIGSNVADALAARGDDVLVVDDLSTGRRENVAGALGLDELDVTDAAALQRACLDFRPEVVFHLAAQIDVRRSVEDPAGDAHVNVEGTINVLRAARAAGARRVVFSSTGGAIYGEADGMPTSEDAPALPLSPYGQAKLAAEGYCALFARLHGLSTVALRYANVYGPRQDPLGEGGVVAIFCGRRREGAGEATVFGDGRQTRDFTYVGDVVEANLVAADSAATGAYNIGTGVETSVLELAGQLGLEPVHAPARPGEVRRSSLDPERAARALGWRPRVSLEEGVRATLGWLSSTAGPC
jgi:UDP-glucose 4-epimerase